MKNILCEFLGNFDVSLIDTQDLTFKKDFETASDHRK